MTTEEKILKQLSENPIILYMKGVPDNPECGFSAKAVAALKATGISYTFVNVMRAPFIREKLPKVSKWPTFPQLFINGELIGGSDIIEAMAQDGSLLPALQAAQPQPAKADGSVVSHAEVEQLIKGGYPDAEIFIEGEGCDLTITVVSNTFAGQPMVKQQQGVMATLTEPLGSGRLHAVTIKAFTPDQWQDKLAAQGAGAGLLQIQA
ncbi:MAG: Grx4 family monothiol glutaredoxin [Gammaproteobacteria bacterium]